MTDENNNTVEDVVDEPTPAPKKKAVRKDKPKTVKVIAKVRIGTEDGTCQIGDELDMKPEDARVLQKLGKIEVVI